MTRNLHTEQDVNKNRRRRRAAIFLASTAVLGGLAISNAAWVRQGNVPGSDAKFSSGEIALSVSQMEWEVTGGDGFTQVGEKAFTVGPRVGEVTGTAKVNVEAPEDVTAVVSLQSGAGELPNWLKADVKVSNTEVVVVVETNGAAPENAAAQLAELQVLLQGS